MIHIFTTQKKKTIIMRLTIFTLLLASAVIWSNSYIETENIIYSGSDIPEAFDGVKIVHLSDYHNHGGNYEDRLVSKIKSAEPDYIFLTGDQVDSYLTDTDNINSFFRKVSETAPCYLVWGNHEKSLDTNEFIKIKNSAENCGITVLDGESADIERNGQKITVTGTYSCPEDFSVYSEKNDSDNFNIWLHHFPEDFEKTADGTKSAGCQMDLMFSGHAHGGLIRLPFTDGLFAPGQGFFPEYSSGIYTYNGSSMIVSRGLGNSSITLRLFDPFHLVVCELKKDDSNH